MPHITIIDENERNVVHRYSSIAKTLAPEEVQVVLVGYSERNIFARPELAKKGFRNVNFGLENIPQADIYFCDGLKGDCFEIADRLGKEKTYIYSNDDYVNDRANREGYKIVDDLDGILEGLKEWQKKKILREDLL